ncbi:MAG: DUF1674 domain-containing protein [Cardiobacteriaceae bacterium]|nr:DUF1674 domain-containing protein [Cardiobacteriaceae bacterium]
MTDTPKPKPQRYPPQQTQADTPAAPAAENAPGKPEEIGGPSGPEPTRYGDWERKGRCVDF